MPGFDDSRIHVCLYFISPTGHSLRSLDLLTMKQLVSRVNVIPLIGKADIVSKQELKAFKRRIREELLNNGINVYQFPTGIFRSIFFDLAITLPGKL